MSIEGMDDPLDDDDPGSDFQRGFTEGIEAAWSECETCGCSGMVEQTETLPDRQSTRVVMVKCPECDGTGVGEMGKRLRRARELGAREMHDAIADAEGRLYIKEREELIATYATAPLPDDGATPDQIANARKEGAATMRLMAYEAVEDLLKGVISAAKARIAGLELP